MQINSVEDKCIQTSLSVVQIVENNNLEFKVQCTRGSQTLIKLIHATDSTIVNQLEYLPFEEIKESCELILDVAKKTVLHFKLPDEEDISDSNKSDVITIMSQNSEANIGTSTERILEPIKSNIRKERVVIKEPKTYADASTQTDIGVAPHVLDEDEVAQVSTTLAIQTSITFDPTDDIEIVGPRLKKIISHSNNALHFLEHIRPKPVAAIVSSASLIQEDSDNSDNPDELIREELIMNETVINLEKVESEIIEPDIISLTSSQFDKNIRALMNNTVEVLETQLQRMITDYGESKSKPRPEIDIEPTEPISTMADQNHDKPNETTVDVQCELGGIDEGTSPLLTKTGVAFDVFIRKEIPIVIGKSTGLVLQAAFSMPQIQIQKNITADPSNPTIRLSSNKKPHEICHCAKSNDALNMNFNHNYRLRHNKPISTSTMAKNTKKNCLCENNDNNGQPNYTNLMYEDDGEYADSYLDMLTKDNEGTQTEHCAEDAKSLDSAIEDKCRCTANIEIPWDDISYKNKHNVPLPPETPEKIKIIIKEVIKEAPPPPPPKDRLKQLVVAEMTEDDLRDLTSKYMDQDLASSGMNVRDIEKQIIDLSKDSDIIDNEIGATSSVSDKTREDKSEHSVKFKSESKGRIVRTSEFVFDPSCDRSNEPYMDKMYSYFPDECDIDEYCSSRTEIPWSKIVVPKRCNIRKVYKHNPTNSSINIGKPTGKKSSKNMNADAFDIQISFAEIASNLIRVDNGAGLQPNVSGTTTVSDLRYKPKRTTKDCIFDTSSHPFIPGSANKKLNNANKPPFSNSRESAFLGSVNINACGKNQSNKSIKPFSSMPHISSKGSVKNKYPVKTDKNDVISGLLKACKKEMEPIKDGINKLRNRIRELNLTDMSQFQYTGQQPQYGTPQMHSYSSIYISPSLNNDSMRMQFPPYPSFIPYCPCNIHQSYRNSERSRKNTRSNRSRRIRSPSKSSSQGTDSNLSNYSNCYTNTTLTKQVDSSSSTNVPNSVHKNKHSISCESCKVMSTKISSDKSVKSVKPSKIPKLIKKGCNICKGTRIKNDSVSNTSVPAEMSSDSVKSNKKCNNKPSKKTKNCKCKKGKSAQLPSENLLTEISFDVNNDPKNCKTLKKKTSDIDDNDEIIDNETGCIVTNYACEPKQKCKNKVAHSDAECMIKTPSKLLKTPIASEMKCPASVQVEHTMPGVSSTISADNNTNKVTVYSKIRMAVPPSSKFRPTTSEKSITTNCSNTNEECK